MKRCIGFLLIFTLLLSFNTGFARAEEQNQEAELTFYEDFLDRLGVIETGGQYQSDSMLTKGQFVAIAMRMINQQEAAQVLAPEQIFFDVTTDMPEAPLIQLAYEMGYISGKEGGILGYEENITLTDALAVILRIYNYRELVEKNGGYNGGVTKTAAQIGLGSGLGIGYNDYLDCKTAARLVYEAMDYKLTQAVKWGVYRNENTNILTAVFKLEKSEGVINADSRAALYGKPTAEDDVLIDDTYYKISGIDVSAYLGYYGEFYYREDKSERELIYFKNKRTEEIVINAKDVLSHTSSKIEFEEGNKTRKISVSATAATVLNNLPASVGSEGLPVADYGEYRLIDRGGDGTVDAVFIDSRKIVIAEASSNEKIYDKFNPNICYDLDEYNDIRISRSDGTPCGVEDINKYSVLEIAENEDIIDIRVVDDSDSFSVVGKSSLEDGVYEIETSDGEVFETIKSFTEDIEAGGQYIFIFTSDGRIAYAMTGENTKLNYGYLCRWVFDTDGGLDRARFRIFTMEGKFINVVSGEKIKSGREKYSPEVFVSEMRNPQIMVYRLNSEGELVQMDFPDDDIFAAGFRRVGSVGPGGDSYANRYYTSSKLIGGRILVTDKTKIMLVPEKENILNTDEFRVSTSAYLTNFSYYPNSEAYSMSNDDNSAELIVIKGRKSAIVAESGNLFVKRISEACDDDDNLLVQIVGYVNGKEQSFLVNQNTPAAYTTKTGEIVPVEPGDVIKYEVDKNEYISAVKVLLDYSKQRVYGINDSNDDSTEYGYSMRQSLGYVEKKSGACVYIRRMGQTDMTEEMYNLSNALIYEYDTKTNKTEPVTVNDLAGSVGRMIYISQYFSNVDIAVIYK